MIAARASITADLRSADREEKSPRKYSCIRCLDTVSWVLSDFPEVLLAIGVIREAAFTTDATSLAMLVKSSSTRRAPAPQIGLPFLGLTFILVSQATSCQAHAFVITGKMVKPSLSRRLSNLGISSLKIKSEVRKLTLISRMATLACVIAL